MILGGSAPDSWLVAGRRGLPVWVPRWFRALKVPVLEAAVWRSPCRGSGGSEVGWVETS